MTTYDLIIIGGGAGGYIAAERAGARGLNVLLIERAQLGGVCLNAGCIPSKALLASAKVYAQIKEAGKFGVTVKSAPKVDYKQVIERKRRVVQSLRDGVGYQMNRRSVTVINGQAEFVDRQTVAVDGTHYKARKVIIATGASPVIPQVAGIERAMTTTQILDHETLPKTLAILGGGALAVNMAAIFSMFDVNVSVIDPGEQLLPFIDPEITALLAQEMPQVAFYQGARVEAVEPKHVRFVQGGNTISVKADAVLVCGDRAPNIDGLGLERIGVDVTGGRVHVNEFMQTNVPDVYAIGDVTALSMWAHAAQRMANVAVSHILHGRDRFRLSTVPTVIYTSPEVATVGLTEAQAKAQGHTVKVARLPLNANGRAVTDTEGKRGLCKVVIDARTRVLLGVHLMGPYAGDLIFGAAAMLEDEFRVQDVTQLTFAHPTISEWIKDTVSEFVP